MLIKDKALLESLTKKYGKNYILNEISRETIISARDKADKLGRHNQKNYFSDGLARKEKQIAMDIIRNLSLELVWDDGFEQIYFDKNSPIIIDYSADNTLHINIIEDYSFLEDYEHLIVKRLSNILNKKPSDSWYIFPIRYQDRIKSFDEGISFTDEKWAKKWSTLMEKINEKLGFEYIVDIDWHNYYEL